MKLKNFIEFNVKSVMINDIPAEMEESIREKINKADELINDEQAGFEKSLIEDLNGYIFDLNADTSITGLDVKFEIIEEDDSSGEEATE